MSRKREKKNTLISELRKEGKINADFLDRVSELTLEELLSVKIELSAKMVNGKLYGMPIWYSMPYIVRESLLNFVYRNCRTKRDMADTLGLPYDSFVQIYRKYLQNKDIE